MSGAGCMLVTQAEIRQTTKGYKMEKKLLADLTEELVNVLYELEKVKYSRPDRSYGWIRVGYLLSIGLDNGLGKRQLASSLQQEIDTAKTELATLVLSDSNAIAS
jgi:hypothetical protein